jgi:hypothetical protein
MASWFDEYAKARSTSWRMSCFAHAAPMLSLFLDFHCEVVVGGGLYVPAAGSCN